MSLLHIILSVPRKNNLYPERHISVLAVGLCVWGGWGGGLLVPAAVPSVGLDG